MTSSRLQRRISIFQRPPSDADFDENPSRIENELSPDRLAQIILMAFFGTLLTSPDDPAEQVAQGRRTLGFFEHVLIRR